MDKVTKSDGKKLKRWWNAHPHGSEGVRYNYSLRKRRDGFWDLIQTKVGGVAKSG